MFRFSYRIAQVLVIASLALFSHLARAANPQSGDTMAKAKVHYQNAVAAIAKSDWQTAKNELLQAVKLAPQNALVHYDLALAYSHTGQAKSAQTELNKALQIGLPTEQEQAAQELKQQFASQASDSKHVVSGNEALVSREKEKPAQQPSLSEILDWLKAKVMFSTPTARSTLPSTAELIGFWTKSRSFSPTTRLSRQRNFRSGNSPCAPNRTASLTCDDGNGNIVFTKNIEHTDFPLDEITLYFANNVIHLPSEY
jgi:hypothetical protein